MCIFRADVKGINWINALLTKKKIARGMHFLKITADIKLSLHVVCTISDQMHDDC